MGSRLEANSNAVRKRIENHTFDNEEGEEYKGSKFGGFPEYFRRKKIKLQNLDAELRSQSTQNPQIFRGIVANVNGFTQPSLNDLHRMIVSHGGGFMQYLDGKTTVTHIIASSLTPKKIEEFKRYRIVKPAWIVDSVEAGRLLPWDRYRVVDEGKTQKIIGFENGHVVNRINNKPTGYRDQTDASWYTSQLAKNDPIAGTELEVPQDPILSKEEVVGISSEIVQQEEKAEEENFDEDDHLYSDIDELISPGQLTPKHAPASDAGLLTAGKDEDAREDNVDSDHPALSEAPPLTLKRNSSQDASIEPSPKRSKLTAEEHNAILLADPRIRKSSTLNPDFLEQYYRESRLHHLSAWKADLKSQLQALTAEMSASQKTRAKRPPGARRYILHVDFDSFFVAVSLKNHPQYVDRPACVAHGGGSGSEIASCNYPARVFGVKNGMWMKKAQELCKDLKVLPYDFPAYEAASRKFYDAIMATGGIVQSVSIDEALVDVTTLCLPAGGTDGIGVREGSIWREQAKADEIAQNLRDKVKEETGCAVSVGIGNNILLAKVALRKAKPAGQHQIKPEEVLDFLATLEVQDLPGVAHSIGGKLEEIGIKLVKDIREVSKERLTNTLGPKTAEKIYGYARGIDKTEVGDQVVRKSVSAEVNWGVRFETQEQADEFIESLCGELSRRLLKEGVKGKQLTMKVMRRAADAPLDPPKHLGHGKCDTFNKSIVLGVATNTVEVLAREALSIMRGFGFSPGELRGLGIQMTKLEPIKASVNGLSPSSQRRLQFKAAPAAVLPKLAADSVDVTIADAIQMEEAVPKETHIESLVKDDTTSKDIFRSPRLLFQDVRRTKPSDGQPEDVTRVDSRTGVASSQHRIRFLEAVKPIQATVDPSADPIQDEPEVTHRAHMDRAIPMLPPGLGQSVDSPNRKPLNTLGTQFILPTQVDPAVLAELPEDIKSRLAKYVQRPTESPISIAGPGAARPMKPFASTILPSESQLDLEALQALPEDVRDEVLAHYATSPSGKSRTAGQTVLPQSPRKVRTVAVSRGKTSTRGRGRPRGGSSLLSRLKGASNSGISTLTQTSFVTRPQGPDHTATDSEGGAGSETEVSADFLAALPEDIRAEVLAQKRTAQLRRNGGLEFAGRRRGQGVQKRNVSGAGIARIQAQQQQTARGERIWTLAPWPQKPSFTTRKLNEIGDLRRAVEEWVDVFKSEGPYGEDVEALGRYLIDVIREERDMEKVVSVVEWMGWVVGGLKGGATDTGQAKPERTAKDVDSKLNDNTQLDTGQGKRKWMEAVGTIKGFVTEAVKARGLGEVYFDSFV